MPYYLRCAPNPVHCVNVRLPQQHGVFLPAMGWGCDGLVLKMGRTQVAAAAVSGRTAQFDLHHAADGLLLFWYRLHRPLLVDTAAPALES